MTMPAPTLQHRIGYQGEPHSYSHEAIGTLYPDATPVGLASFAEAFAALADGRVDRLMLPIENSTTGSVLEVLDGLVETDASIIREHYAEIRHALIGIPDADPSGIRRVLSHPEALRQVKETVIAQGWEAVIVADTAGAVREVAERGDPTIAALGPPGSGTAHGLEVLASDVIDRDHNTTRVLTCVSRTTF